MSFAVPTGPTSGNGGGADPALDGRVEDLEGAVTTLEGKVIPATPAQIRAGVAGILIDADGLVGASGVLIPGWGATLTLDFNIGRNWDATLLGNTVLGNPTNQRLGQSGIIMIRQDATGGRTLSYAANWRPLDGVPVLPTTPNSVSFLGYYVRASGEIYYWLAGTWA